MDEYHFIHSNIIEKTHADSISHAVLTGLAIGDGQAHTAFKRAKLSSEEGSSVIEHLIELKLIRREKSREKSNSWIDENSVSDKFHFNSTFMKFWFAFVSPIFKGIQEGNYEEFMVRFENRKQEYIEQLFTLISQDLIREKFIDDTIVEMGSYWDKNGEFDIYAKTASHKTVIGTCKYTNSKIKKSELNRAKENLLHVKLNADIFVLVSKRGFSNELKSLKGDNLKLFTLRNFKSTNENG